jgi:hypothetical protein
MQIPSKNMVKEYSLMEAKKMSSKNMVKEYSLMEAKKMSSKNMATVKEFGLT